MAPVFADPAVDCYHPVPYGQRVDFGPPQDKRNSTGLVGKSPVADSSSPTGGARGFLYRFQSRNHRGKSGKCPGLEVSYPGHGPWRCQPDGSQNLADHELPVSQDYAPRQAEHLVAPTPQPPVSRITLGCGFEGRMIPLSVCFDVNKELLEGEVEFVAA